MESVGVNLGPNGFIKRDQCITSNNGWYRLALYPNGKLILESANSHAVLFDRGDPRATKATFRSDGNFCLTDDTGTSIFYETASYQSAPVSALAILDNGSVVIYLRGNPRAVAIQDFPAIKGSIEMTSPGGPVQVKVRNDAKLPVVVNGQVVIAPGSDGGAPMKDSTSGQEVKTQEKYTNTSTNTVTFSSGQVVLMDTGGGNASAAIWIGPDGHVGPRLESKKDSPA